jgi:hypothetical protein
MVSARELARPHVTVTRGSLSNVDNTPHCLECFATAKLLLGTKGLGSATNQGEAGLRHFIANPYFVAGVIIAVRRKGTSQRKKRTADLPCN